MSKPVWIATEDGNPELREGIENATTEIGETMTVKDLGEIERLMKEDDAAMERIVKHYVQDLIDEIVRLKLQRRAELVELAKLLLYRLTETVNSQQVEEIVDAYLTSRKEKP
jgi:hypothetical protein